MKRAAATGVAVTGITAFGGNAAAQQPQAEIQNNTVSTAQGLITVQVSGVNVNALNANNIEVTFEEEVVNVEDVTIVGDDLVDIDIDESQILNLTGNTVQLTVAILGGAVSDTETVNVLEN